MYRNKSLSCLLLLVASLFLSACSLPSAPPATVTDPAVRSLYASALAGDGDALYRVSHMYGSGTDGFPQSDYYATVALDEAAEHNYPQAVYDVALKELHRLRDKLTNAHARNDTYNNWGELEDGLIEVRREVVRAGTLGDARAAATLPAIDEDLARYRQLTHRERLHYHKCHQCGGSGSAHKPDTGARCACPHCEGRGYIEW